MVGNMSIREEILDKAESIAKYRAKEYPVILFCKNDTECANLKPKFDLARIFGEGSDTAELLDIIT